MGRMGRRLARLGAGVLLVSSCVVAERAARVSLERRAREVDLLLAIRGIGLEGRVATPSWEGSRLRWLPRPALRLKSVKTSVLSGRPGPGAASGYLRLDSVDLVPAWGFPLRAGLQRVEIRGGCLEIGADLLPSVPRDYLDPISGTSRPIPWNALLHVMEASGSGDTLLPVSPEMSWPASVRRTPLVLASNLEIRLPAAFLPVGEALQIGEVRLFAGGERLELAGGLRIRTNGHLSAVPVRVLRFPGESGRGTNWEFALGSDSSGVRIRTTATNPGAAAAWSGELRDAEGNVGQAFLDGRSGPMGRLRWKGPWSLEAHGAGWRLSGVSEATVRLRGGALSVSGSDTPSTMVSGSLRILPGRIDVSRLLLTSRVVGGPDSAEVGLHWLSTTSGIRLSGDLRGSLDPGWVALLGEEWSAAGRIQTSMTLDGTKDARSGGGWNLIPRGRLEGSFERLGGPWFADRLEKGSLEAWGASGRVGFVVAGVWGTSPFRLEARDLPLPNSRQPNYTYAETRWEFSSPSCRIEDFRLNQTRFPGTGVVPCWLALPGQGGIRIDHGALYGMAFDSVFAGVERRGSQFRLDHLAGSLGGGSINAGSAWAGGRRAGAPSGETRMELTDVDLVRVRPLLARLDSRMAAGLEGLLSATVWLHWPDPAGHLVEGLTLNGTVRVADGRLGGLPVQEALRRQTHLDGLAALSFDLLQADISQEDAILRWNRLRLDAPPLRIEGAGRLDGSDSLRFVLSVRSTGEAGDALGTLVASLIGGDQHALYAILTGPPRKPDVRVLSRSGFLRELDRLGGLPSGSGQ